ncbi:ATP-dependent DNA helicase Q-like 3 [Contarinia nasturtii]|uniref:ATP-dependent DNA helicase Q-like 3 n=1 Tax=Contarinia nasturtii TaxID=265458 RepID=UPI0012D4891B|nr:ATP-dependent DNA helicase Q-like 3 [Contarinia nasturtii]
MDEPLKSSAKSKSSSSSSSKQKKDEKTSKEDIYTSDFLRKKLKVYFNHSDFKSSLQKDAIREIMRGKRDVYISMPTGSGKSLCYQLPGMLHENKITIVFSPLIALIKDQMDHLTKIKISAESLNSKMTTRERDRVINDLKSIRPSTKFLYITPEQAATDFFRSLLDSIVKYNKLALVAVDECHCVSEMGHQFRRDYLKLGELRKRYPTIKWIALTATASKEVTSDIFKQLALKDTKSFKTPCFRKNLFYDIIYKNSIQDDYIHLKEFVTKCLKTKNPDDKPNKAPCGIIYCRTRESVERVANGLTKQNIVSKPYHAGINDKDRKQYQEDWTDGKFPVICATNSFGMGVDKATVRFVVHWDVPQNIAAYYQESGRAGRDGLPSFCRLYYCRQEVKTINFLLQQQLQKDPDNVKSKRSVKEFERLVDNCESLRCRHLLFSHYFGDHPPDCKQKQLCDVCKDYKGSEKKLENFHRLALNGFTSKMDVDFDSSDLYEGGRNAVQESETAYTQVNDDDHEEYGATKRDAKAKRETTNLIQKEFERRKQKIEAAKKLEQTQTRSFGIRIRSSIHTSKIAGLDVKKREIYLDFLLKVLKENAEKASEKPPHPLKGCDFEDIAAELEYNCFTKNRVFAMYQKSITVERLRIDRSTKNNELLTEIKNHTPKKRTAYGGSSEAMQRDLDDFMEKNKIVDETNNTANHANVGFQTARQINNKLRETNRMKKDPLTQMSINSFFSTASIKREPEEDNVDDNQNGLENSQPAKRRKVDIEAPRIKTEPMDTNESTENMTSVPIKNEPINYDSDCGTEKGSDDEMDTMTHTSKQQQQQPAAPPPNRITTNAKNIEFNPQNVKTERNYDGADTDEASDNDGETVTGVNQVQRKKTKSQRDNEQQARDQRIGTHRSNQCETITSQPRQLVQNEIISEIGLNCEEESMAMVVAEPVRVNDDIKDEPVESDEETDDESNVNNQNVEPQSVSANFHDDDRYQQPSTSTAYPQHFTALPPPPIHQEPIYDQPLYNVGLKSTKSVVNAVDGNPLLRFNQFERPAEREKPMKNYVEIVDDDDINYDELGDEIEKYVEDMEQAHNEELEQLKKINMAQLNIKERAALAERLKKLLRKKELIYKEKVKEEAKKTEKEQEKIRSNFMSDLFGSNFKLDILEKRMLHKTFVTDRGAREQKVISYSDFMMKPIKCEDEKTKKEYHVSMALNEHIHKMNEANMLDLVPQKVIDKVRNDKMTIKNKVERYLMPFYNDRRINKKEYENICQTITHYQYESNEYSSAAIRDQVLRVVTDWIKNRESMRKAK